jgi:hypothetical protein
MEGGSLAIWKRKRVAHTLQCNKNSNVEGKTFFSETSRSGKGQNRDKARERDNGQNNSNGLVYKSMSSLRANLMHNYKKNIQR